MNEPANESQPVFPAHAGMIPGTAEAEGSGTGVPRTCGDDPARFSLFVWNSGCSPHMRG